MLHIERSSRCNRYEPEPGEWAAKSDHKVSIAILAHFLFCYLFALETHSVHDLHSVQNDGDLVAKDNEHKEESQVDSKERHADSGADSINVAYCLLSVCLLHQFVGQTHNGVRKCEQAVQVEQEE